MPTSFPNAPRRRTNSNMCTDQVVGNILSGWRYDISGLSPCDADRLRAAPLGVQSLSSPQQRVARTIDVLLISVSTLSIAAFLLVTVVLHRVELITHIASVHVQLHHTAVAISLQAVAFTGLLFSCLALDPGRGGHPAARAGWHSPPAASPRRSAGPFYKERRVIHHRVHGNLPHAGP